MKRILSLVRKAIQDYGMIAENDRIAVGLSGGKDSLALLWALAKLRQFYPKRFELAAITLDMGDGQTDYSGLSDFCSELGVPFCLKRTDIKKIVFDIRHEKNPCALCSKMRRGALHDAALEMGFRKVALGHHFDDVVETFFLNLFYEGRIGCFQPVTYLDRKRIYLIRPLIYVPEALISSFSRTAALPVVESSCPANGKTSRHEVKDLLSTMEKGRRGLKGQVFGALQRSGIDGWRPAHREEDGVPDAPAD